MFFPGFTRNYFRLKNLGLSRQTQENSSENYKKFFFFGRDKLVDFWTSLKNLFLDRKSILLIERNKKSSCLGWKISLLRINQKSSQSITGYKFTACSAFIIEYKEVLS